METRITDFAFPETIAQAIRQDGWFIVTATQEAQGAWTSPENLTADAMLRKHLLKSGATFTTLCGTYKGVDQGPGYLVRGSVAEGLKLARAFGQESILTNLGLVYTNGDLTPVDHTKTLLGPAARGADFFSEVAITGQLFSLGLDLSIRKPQFAV